MSKLGIFAGALVVGLTSMVGCGGDDDADGNNTDTTSSSSSGGTTVSSSGEPGSSSGDPGSSSGDPGSSSGASGNAACEPPAEYPGADTFALPQNGGSGLSLRKALVDLNGLMTGIESDNDLDGTTEAELLALYNGPPPPAVGLATVASDMRKEHARDTISAFHAAVGGDFDLEDDAPEAGFSNGWIFDENGVDLRQIVEKGSFAGEQYRIFSAADPRPWDGSRVDQAVALFGTTPAFSTDENDPVSAARPVHTARYSKNRAMPIFERFKTAAIAAKHAATVGDECSAELQAALGEMKLAWEESLAATVIYYLNRTSTELGATGNGTNGKANKANGLHGLGEVAGFLTGLRSVPAAERKATDAQLDAVLTALYIGHDSKVPFDWTKGTDNAATEFPDVILEIAEIYGFTEAQVNSFKGGS